MRALPGALCLALCASAAAAQTSPSAEPGSQAVPDDPSERPDPDPPARAEPEAEAGEPDAEAADAEAAEEPAGGSVVPPPPPPISDCSQGCLRAESQGGGEGHYWARGFVDFQAGELHIQSDRFDLYQEDAEDGTTSSRRIVAEGNVVFMRGDERMSGDRMEMDLLSDTAVLENASGYVEPDMFVEARRLERIDSRTYRIEGGRFTSCYQPNPRWSFSASSATLKRNDRITANNVVFRVKSLPTLYLPFFYYPIRDDQRATGILFPRFGYSSFRGFNVGSGFFWAMSRNSDQTFSTDYYSKFGVGYGHELRYVGLGQSFGRFSTTLFDRSDVDTTDYDLTWQAAQDLPGNFRGSVNARLFSSTAFQQRVQDNLDLASSRSQRASLAVSGRLGKDSLQLVADHNETFFGEDSRVIQRLPSLRISRSRSRIGRTGIVFGYEARAERLARGDQDATIAYQRFDVAPSISRPWGTSFMQLDPSVGLRYTRYSASFDEEGLLEGGPIDRPLLETNVEMRGPNFAKVFSLGGFYSPRFKHEIGPEVAWTYRTAVDDFDVLPRFDGIDQLLGTNQLRYSLVQRLLAKRPSGAAGRLSTHEVLSWRVSQTYFAQIGDNQSEFDPNFSTSFYSPDGEPSHYSPIQSRVRFAPTRQVRATFDLEYDVNFKQTRSLGLALDMRLPRGGVQASWSKAERLTDVVEERDVIRSTVRASGQYDLLPDSIELSGAADYDFVSKSLIRWSGRARLGVQCCALMLEVISFDYNGRDERQFRFALELANIGSFGFDGGQPNR